MTVTTTETTGGQRHHEADPLAAGGGGPGSYALICHDPAGRGVAATYWPTREEARQAEAELTPCGPRCGGVHTVVERDPPLRHPAALGLPRSLRIIYGHNGS